MDVMYHPPTSSVVGFCNEALSALYTVSPAIIADVRRVLHRLCHDLELLGKPLREDCRKPYRSEHDPLTGCLIIYGSVSSSIWTFSCVPIPDQAMERLFYEFMIQISTLI